MGVHLCNSADYCCYGSKIHSPPAGLPIYQRLSHSGDHAPRRAAEAPPLVTAVVAAVLALIAVAGVVVRLVQVLLRQSGAPLAELEPEEGRDQEPGHRHQAQRHHRVHRRAQDLGPTIRVGCKKGI